MDDTPVVLPEFETDFAVRCGSLLDSSASDGKDKPSFRERTLMLGNVLIKQYAQPSVDSPGYPTNQELVLLAFEEEGWPRCIDDPLRPPSNSDGMDLKRRRLETARSINRRMKVNLIRFRPEPNGFSWGYVT